MSWNLVFNCSSEEAHKQLEEKVANTKEGRTQSEKDHIDAVVEVFRKLVPKEAGYSVYFQVSGHSNTHLDVSVNFSCSIFKS
jgi:hypothetical protein